mgnify:CR=1 FL=1
MFSFPDDYEEGWTLQNEIKKDRTSINEIESDSFLKLNHKSNLEEWINKTKEILLGKSALDWLGMEKEEFL